MKDNIFMENLVNDTIARMKQRIRKIAIENIDTVCNELGIEQVEE